MFFKGVLTNCLQCAFDGECHTKSCECRTLHSISGVAFILLRLLACQQEELDLTRLMKLASFGALVHGSTGHFFYNFLDSKMPGTTALTVVKKVFIDQVSRPANPYSLAQLPSSQFPRPLPVLCLTNSTAPCVAAVCSTFVFPPCLVLGAYFEYHHSSIQEHFVFSTSGLVGRYVLFSPEGNTRSTVV